MAKADTTIIIDGNEFAKGMTTSAELSDGGFSPETTGVNLLGQIGCLNAPGAVTDKSTNLTGEAIAYCNTSVTATNGYILATDGKILSINSSQVLTASSALTGTFTTGTSDIEFFVDKIYATNSTDVCRMNSDLTAGDATWWSGTLGKGVLTSGVRHPLLTFNGYVWVGDANALHQIVSSSSGNKNALQLTIGNEITALGIDPSNGQMLIASTQGANYSGTIATGNKVFVYDGVSALPSREIAVDYMITAFRNVGGVLYVGMGNKIGYWNGSGVTFLRTLKNVTLAGANLVYKHHMTNIQNTLYVVDGTQLLAFGDVIQGRKSWYYALKNAVGDSGNYSLICPVGDNKIGLGLATTKFYTFDPSSVAAVTSGGTLWYSRNYSFDDKIKVRKIRIKFKTPLPAVSENLGTLTVYFDNNKSWSNTFSNTVATGAVYEKDFIPEGDLTTDVQLRLSLAPETASSVYSIKKIVVYITSGQ